MELFHGIHMDLSMESMVDMPTFHMESSGIHDVHGTMNWLWSQPTLIPWVPGGFHMDYTREGKDLKISECIISE